MITFDLVKGKWYKNAVGGSGYMRFDGRVYPGCKRGYDRRIWSNNRSEYHCDATIWREGYVHVPLKKLIELFPQHKKFLLGTRRQSINDY